MVMPAETSSRFRGWTLIVLGLCLSLGMVATSAHLAVTITNDGRQGGAVWTGNHEFTARCFQLFAAIFAFGLTAIFSGINFLRRGRAGAPALIVMLVLVALMIYFGRDIMQF